MADMGISGNAKALCKNCGCYAPADQFKLHFTLKQMVCNSCYTGKNQKDDKKKVESSSTPVANTPARPKGWDKEDDYLEKASRVRKQENQNHFTKIPGTDQVMCNCPNCKYQFRYDPYRKVPNACPYCNAGIPRLKTFNLL
jgi:hypothetical protein